MARELFQGVDVAKRGGIKIHPAVLERVLPVEYFALVVAKVSRELRQHGAADEAVQGFRTGCCAGDGNVRVVAVQFSDKTCDQIMRQVGRIARYGGHPGCLGVG